MTPRRSIFRAATLSRYVSPQEELVPPTIVTPPTQTCAGLFAVLLLFGGTIVAVTTIPDYVPACAVMLETADFSGYRLLIIVPGEARFRIQPGQTGYMRGSGHGSWSPSLVVTSSAESDAASLDRLQRTMKGSECPEVKDPVIAMGRFVPGERLPAESHSPGIHVARIWVGSRRIAGRVLESLVSRWIRTERS